MKKNILITGASGFVGKDLLSKIDKDKFNVRILSRSNKENNENIFTWNIDKWEIDKKAIEDIDVIIHLAGAGIADKRWTKNRKSEIISSRVDSLRLIYENLNHNKAIHLISTSAIGIYGARNSDKIFREEDAPFDDFISKVCVLWEENAMKFKNKGHKVSIIRTGIVLGKGGALTKMLTPFKLGIGSAIGSGKQFMPWIHIDDLSGIYLYLLSNELEGVYNAVAPDFTDNFEFSKTIAKVLNKPFFFPNVPSFALKIIFGEMANILLYGSKISSNKIISKSYDFKFKDLESSLKDVLLN